MQPASRRSTKYHNPKYPKRQIKSTNLIKSVYIAKKRNKLPPSTILTAVILLDAECSTCCSFWVCQGLIVDDVQEKQKDWQRLARALLDFGLFRLFGLLGCRPHSGHMPIATVMTISYAFTILGFRRNFIVFHNLIP
jgi:hypothetical protein